MNGSQNGGSHANERSRARRNNGEAEGSRTSARISSANKAVFSKQTELIILEEDTCEGEGQIDGSADGRKKLLWQKKNNKKTSERMNERTNFEDIVYEGVELVSKSR